MALFSSHTDEELLKSLKDGDEGAFTEIYNRYWDRLLGVAAAKLDKDWPLAEELVQEIFLDIWQRRETLMLSGSVSSYLAAAMKYKVINTRLKRHKTRFHIQRAIAQVSLTDDSTRQQLSFEELKDQLARLVRNLPDKCRLVYQLSREAGYSQKEIAAELDISERTVESHLFRAMKSLKSGLSQLFTFLF